MDHTREQSDMSFLNNFANELSGDDDISPKAMEKLIDEASGPRPPSGEVTANPVFTKPSSKRRSTRHKKKTADGDDGNDTDTDDENDQLAPSTTATSPNDDDQPPPPPEDDPLRYSTGTTPLRPAALSTSSTPSRPAALSTSSPAGRTAAVSTTSATSPATRPGAASVTASTPPRNPAISVSSPTAQRPSLDRPASTSTSAQPPPRATSPTQSGFRERASSNRGGASSLKKDVPPPLNPGPLDSHADLASLTRGLSQQETKKPEADSHAEHSPSKQDKPAHTIPASPRLGGIENQAGKGVKVFFIKPASDGGEEIVKYDVIALNAKGAEAKVVSGLESPILVTDLVVGESYRFVIKAVNSVGVSPASEASLPVTIEAKKSFLCCSSSPSVSEGSLPSDTKQSSASSSKPSSSKPSSASTSKPTINTSTPSKDISREISLVSPSSVQRKKKPKPKSLVYEDEEFIEEIRKLGQQSRTVVYSASSRAPLV